MIDFSGRATRAGTRGIAAAAVVSCFTVMPQLASHETANADGPGGSASRTHDHRPAGREHDARQGGREDVRPGAREHDVRTGGKENDGRTGAGNQADHQAAPERDHGTSGREQQHRPAGAERDRRGRRLPPRTRIIFDTQAPQGPVVPGRTYSWPYSVTNTGSEPAKNVTFTTRPNRHLKVLATPEKCHWRGGRDLICDIGVVPGGGTKRGTLTATVDPNAPNGRPLSSPAKISWQGRPGSTAREAAFPPVKASRPTDLAVTDSALPEVVRPGSEVPYEISVTNEGPVTAEAVVVRSSVGGDLLGSPCGSPLGPVQTLAGKIAPLKPAVPACGITQDKPQRTAEETPADSPCAARATQAAPPCAAPNSAAGHACGACAGAQAPPAGQACHACGGVQPPAAGQACGACAGARPPATGQACGACAAQHETTAPACGAAGQGAPCGSSPARVAVAPGKADAVGAENGIHGGAPESPVGPGTKVDSPTRSEGNAEAPGGDTPIVIGKDRHHCVTQGAGFICPLGSIPPGKTRTLRLAVRGRPHAHPGRFRCVSTVGSGTPDENPGNNSVACHTRNARPIPARPVSGRPVGSHRLPHTGFPYGTVALGGLGLAGAGLLLLRIGRRRSEEGQIR
ncbi:hypothetical protein [Actinoallomurus sp. NPDC050550]|uniref:hypothetical protein n=1 Tax=Actinoallomurus sp. NPDC050550 TaxID=3154937 RepID=UPI0033FD1B66